MFSRVLLAFLLAAPAARAAEPSFTAQAQPLSRLLADVRAFVKVVAGPEGDRALEGMDKGIKEALGEKGFEGLDLNRHLAAYGTLAADPAKSSAVLVLPTTGDKDFLDLLGRIKLKATAVDGKAGLHRVEPAPPAGGLPVPVYLRLVEGAAYLSVNDPKGASLDPAGLPAAETLVKLEDQALVTVRANPAALPAKVVRQPFEMFDQLRKGGRNGGGRGMFAMGPMEFLVLPYLLVIPQHLDAVLADAQEVAVRLSLPAAELAVELSVTPKPGTGLAAAIAGYRPPANRFAGLLPKSPAVGAALTLPFSVAKARDGGLEFLDVADKEKQNAPPPVRPVLDELIKGLRRTVSAGDVDFAGAMTGVDEKGRTHAVAAVTFDDPSGIEKALRGMVKGLPEEVAKGVTFDAAKAGAVGLHTVKVGPGLDPEMRKMFGDEALVCVAFTPTAVFAAIGPDPVPVVTAALAVKAGPAKPLDVLVNPNRLHKVVVTAEGEEDGKRFEQILGTEDRTLSVVSVAAEGGAAFRVRLTLSPLFLPRAVARTAPAAAPAALGR